MTIKNLAFKGGGVLGIAYAGAIKVLEDNNVLSSIEKVAGTSAGALTALLVSLNYSAAEVLAISQSTDFSSFEDNPEPLRLLTKYGYYSGDNLLEFIRKALTDKGLDNSISFISLRSAGYKDLHVFASDLNTQGIQEFSADSTPDAIVAEAIRASMSIPAFFHAWQLSNNSPNNHIYVDGGVLYNYPLTAFDSESGINQDTVGFYLADLNNSSADTELGYGQMNEYVKLLFETMLNSQEVDFHKDPAADKRTIQIDDLGISSTDFKLTKEQQTSLYNSGITYTQKYFTTNG